MTKTIKDIENLLAERDAHVQDMYTHAAMNNTQQRALSNKAAQEAKAKLLAAIKALYEENAIMRQKLDIISKQNTPLIAWVEHKLEQENKNG